MLTPPGSLTSTVGTLTTAGAAQPVTLSATGPTATFSPATVTSGQSSTMTIEVPAGTANGTYTINVLADRAAADHTVDGCVRAWYRFLRVRRASPLTGAVRGDG